MRGGTGLTYADLASLPDDGFRRELIDGGLIVSPSPKVRHQELSGRLYMAFATHVTAHGGGKVFYGPLDVVFSDSSVVEPDLMFIGDDQLDIITEKNVRAAPALVIEIVSDSRLDRVRKRDLYARFGVPEYWIVDPDADRVEIYRASGGTYGRPEILELGDTLRFERLPALAIDLRALFER